MTEVNKVKKSNKDKRNFKTIHSNLHSSFPLISKSKGDKRFDVTLLKKVIYG